MKSESLLLRCVCEVYVLEPDASLFYGQLEPKGRGDISRVASVAALRFFGVAAGELSVLYRQMVSRLFLRIWRFEHGIWHFEHLFELEQRLWFFEQKRVVVLL